MKGSFSGERPGRGGHFSYDESRHLAAYYHARELADGKDVLDVGCGEGFGTQLLSETASSVLGIDYSGEAIGKATGEFSKTNLEFCRMDVAELSRLGRQFDLVCSFQLLEHLRHPLPFVEAVARCLRPDGSLLLTTPNRLSSVSENPYHVKEYTAAELERLLSQVLSDVKIYGMMGNERVAEYDRRRGAQVRRILRFDPFGIRHWLPAPVVHWVFGRLAVIVRRRLSGGRDDPASVFTPGDFFVDVNSSEGALDLVARGKR